MTSTVSAFLSDARQIRPLRAWRSLRALIANPQNTGEVFKIIEALKGDALGRAVRRLEDCPQGRVLLRDKPDILPLLNDRRALADLPRGSLGRAYLHFVESREISADGLVAASEEASGRSRGSGNQRWLGNRLRDIHDLQHVICDYGPDELGELCLLAFMGAQTPNRGIAFIVAMGRRQFRLQAPHIDIDGCVTEGRLTGEGALWFASQRWEDRLAEPLEALRVELGVPPPQRYREALASLIAPAG